MKRSNQRYLYRRQAWGIVLASVILIANQNCSPGFHLENDGADTIGSAVLLGTNNGDGVIVPVPSSNVAGLETKQKAIGDATTAQKLTWSLDSDAIDGEPVRGASFSVMVTKVKPADGSNDTYYVTSPTITTGAEPLRLRTLRISFNGEMDDVATTFTGLDLVIPAQQTVVLSKSIQLHQMDGSASPQDTLALHFEMLWPDGKPLPDGAEVPAPTINGAALYTSTCANCHGAASISTKRGRTGEQIATAIGMIPQMKFLEGRFSKEELAAIAEAIK